jgi:hypothetical protein
MEDFFMLFSRRPEGGCLMFWEWFEARMPAACLAGIVAYVISSATILLLD